MKKETEIFLDVSELPAPEPLQEITSVLGTLGRGAYLRVVHRQEPCLLFPILEKNNFSYLVLQDKPELYEMCIFQKDDSAIEAEVTDLLKSNEGDGPK